MSKILARRAILVLLLALPLTGCLFRSRKVEQHYSTAPLKTATQQQLIDYVNSQAEKLESFQATADIDTSVGGVKKGKVIDYQEIRGYVLLRKPSMLRMIGLMPIVRNRAFDMVSNGKYFKLSIPPKNRFIEGPSQMETPNAKQPLENIRPQQIYDALVIRRVDPTNEIAVFENDFETVTDGKGHTVQQPAYEIAVIRRKDDGGWYLSRKIRFSRIDLLPHHQLEYDPQGNMVTEARYDDYKSYNGINFPLQIEIWRPQEEYDITLTIVKLEMNLPLPDDKFVLPQPPGVEVVRLGQPQASMTPSSRDDDNR
jgi:outer membrane lipoprotein-sorting protein